MNAISSGLKSSVLIATLAIGGCGTVPVGYTVVAASDHVVWEGFGRPQLAQLPASPILPLQAAATTGEFPGHPIHGVWSAPQVVAKERVDGAGASWADIAFLRELARSDGGASAEPVETPSDTAVASR